ncbi:hypothetical protein [Kribbella pratensis]|uniref:Uncharacterized protein n=1 Tax=Kribbella pratensis TaxID=2512112 RepID=A0A4R8CMJ5_9ACTN|nr:hypothetical protein [Kribbella pratensis]TDW77312.1 hypothetical protein EV653_2477 [Kribbella pratensis]
MSTVENPHAGKGSSVLLDIGGDIGALVVTLPAVLEGEEIELRPGDFASTHAGRHAHGHGHGHSHALPHVAVVPRPSPDGEIVHSAVFFEVPQGNYELYVRPDGPVQLTVDVTGGVVTEADWPQ